MPKLQLVGEGKGGLAFILGYNGLVSAFRKGHRNGNWRRLAKVEKALIRAAIGYTKPGRRLVNPKLVALILGIVKKLTTTTGARIIQAGRAKAQEVLLQYEEKGIFEWIPRLRKWFQETGYIFWLGTTQNNNSQE